MYSKPSSVPRRPGSWWMMLKCLGRKGHNWESARPEEVQHCPTVLSDTSLNVNPAFKTRCCNETHTLMQIRGYRRTYDITLIMY